MVRYNRSKEMVYYFISNVVSPPAVLYMGEDKHESMSFHSQLLATFSILHILQISDLVDEVHQAVRDENEELLRWGFPEDVWFHVDKMSSAHVYLRRPKNMMMEEIPEELISDCVQLVKANSIVGCKTNNIAVVYTEFSNLKKTARMDVGQVGFHEDKKVFTVKVEKKVNEIVNRLNKTKEQRKPNLQEEREERDRQERVEKRRKDEEHRRLEKEELERKKKETEQRSYSSIMVEDRMKTNEFSGDVDYRAVEDDFM